MRIDRYSVSSTTAETTIDLALLAPNDVSAAGLCKRLANFDVEVIGNDAVVTITGKGTFASSTFLPFTEGTFAISGGKRSISGFALSELKFSRTGTTAYTINITRQIGD